MWKNLCRSLKFIWFYVFLLFALLSPVFVFSQTKEQLDDLRTIITLLDYVSKDYAVAVADGEIIDEFEYVEQIDFVEKCIALHKELTPILGNTSFTGLSPKMEELLASIHNLETPNMISEQALLVKNQIIELGILSISPYQWPSVKNGKNLYLNAQNCASCHGITGRGDGDQGAQLDPEPSDFWGEERDALSPLQAYNVIKLGVEGTGMVSYDEVLTESEIWDLAFYLMSIRYDATSSPEQLPNDIRLEDVSKWSDKELEEYLSKEEVDATVEQIRNFQPLRPNPIDVARQELDKSFGVYKTGDIKQAERHALSSYLEGIELVENILNASNPKLVNRIERDMVGYRKALRKGDDAEVERLYHELSTQINEIKEELGDIDYSFAFIYGAGLSILIREALEGLLVILIMLSILRPLGIRKAVNAVHIGWITALGLGVVSWYFVDYLVDLSGASREVMEGLGALIAVVVLLFAGTWLHSHAEAQKWNTFIKTKVDKMKESGNWIGLGIFSFIVVFREAFEVVLFLSSLKLNDPEVATSALSWALITSIVVVAIITVLFLKTAKRLPIRQIFKISAYVIAVLAVILTGKGVAALQEAGYIGVSPIDFIPKITLLGIYPSIEPLISQFVIILILVILTRRNRKPSIISTQ